MKRTISVVLLTRDSEFKKYACNRDNVTEQAKQFANRLATQQPDDTFCVYEKSQDMFVVCRVIDGREFSYLNTQCKADTRYIDVETILHFVGKKTLDTCLNA